MCLCPSVTAMMSKCIKCQMIARKIHIHVTKGSTLIPLWFFLHGSQWYLTWQRWTLWNGGQGRTSLLLPDEDDFLLHFYSQIFKGRHKPCMYLWKFTHMVQIRQFPNLYPLTCLLWKSTAEGDPAQVTIIFFSYCLVALTLNFIRTY